MDGQSHLLLIREEAGHPDAQVRKGRGREWELCPLFFSSSSFSSPHYLLFHNLSSTLLFSFFSCLLLLLLFIISAFLIPLLPGISSFSPSPPPPPPLNSPVSHPFSPPHSSFIFFSSSPFPLFHFYHLLLPFSLFSPRPSTPLYLLFSLLLFTTFASSPLFPLQFSSWVDAVLLVFSLENEASFLELYQLFSQLNASRSDLPIIVVGTQGQCVCVCRLLCGGTRWDSLHAV